MDAAAPVGAAVNRRLLRALLALLYRCSRWAAPPLREERYALIVAGASGGTAYAQQYTRLDQALSQALARAARSSTPPT